MGSMRPSRNPSSRALIWYGNSIQNVKMWFTVTHVVAFFEIHHSLSETR